MGNEVKFEEFNREMERLEACWPMRMEPSKVIARREVLWDRLGEFPAKTLESARNALIDSGLEFLPSVPEIVAACREAAYVPSGKAILPHHRFKEFPHKCAAEKPSPGPALTALQAVFPYEAAHILCPGNIAATCPLCGETRPEDGVFDDLIRRFPQETANWNPLFKGMMACQECERVR
jgi:hypothetical protein